MCAVEKKNMTFHFDFYQRARYKIISDNSISNLKPDSYLNSFFARITFIFSNPVKALFKMKV